MSLQGQNAGNTITDDANKPPGSLDVFPAPCLPCAESESQSMSPSTDGADSSLPPATLATNATSLAMTGPMLQTVQNTGTTDDTNEPPGSSDGFPAPCLPPAESQSMSPSTDGADSSTSLSLATNAPSTATTGTALQTEQNTGTTDDTNEPPGSSDGFPAPCLPPAESQSMSSSTEGADNSTSLSLATNAPSTATTGTALQTEQNTAIGAYSTKAGLTKNHFRAPIRDGVYPVQTMIKKGLVLELNSYLTQTLDYPDCTSVVSVLFKLYPGANVKEKAVYMAVTRLVSKAKKINRNHRGKILEKKLTELRDQEFVMMRQVPYQVQQTSPDTPRKVKLRSQLHQEKKAHRAVKRKLSAAENVVGQFEEVQVKNTALKEMLTDESKARRSSEKLCKSLQNENNLLEEEKKVLEDLVDAISNQYTTVQGELDDISNRFDPTMDSLEHYKNAYEESSSKLEALNKKLEKAQEKLSHLSTRNVNKRIKRRDTDWANVARDKAKLVTAVNNMSFEKNELRELLKETQCLLKESIRQRDKLKDRLDTKTKKKNQVHKDMYKVKQKQMNEQGQGEFTKEDMKRMEERISVLHQKNTEIEQLLALMEDDVIVTFEDGRYTDEIREAIMSLLQMNVAMSKVNTVIRTVLKKLTGKEIGRLPSLGKISHISLEARHLANIEVATAMNRHSPEHALGNSIHGDGTTKFHKKWQNFQVTLPDGSSRTMGLTQMASADTDAVVNTFTDRVRELSATLELSTGKEKEAAFNEIMCSIKSTMTDQGPTMPQFSDRLRTIRTELLPTVVRNWDTCPPEVKESCADFGTFFCKMHPLINFADEINKVLKSFEDITMSGKNPHTMATSEAGVTRLIRTASKAFHHRGSDQSGAEDIFSSYLNNECGTTNHLPYYVGNRANIIFESAAATYFHLEHMTNFVASLPEPNRLLCAVAEDAAEKLHQAELRALGILYKSVTAPLWHLVKTSDNILSLNPTLHHLQKKLEKWAKNGTGLFNGEVAFESLSPVKDELYECLFRDCADPNMEVLTIQALEVASCAMLIILNRQCQDQLPGGKYWNLSEAQTASFQNVPATNMIGERDFAVLDCLVRQKPNVRAIHLESLIMWSNNGTGEWLDGLDPQTKEKYMAQARAHAPEMLKRYNQRVHEIKQERWANLQAKQRVKKMKEQKKIKERVDLTNNVVAQGGIWCSEDQVENELTKLSTKSDEQIRRALYSQLTFHQKIIKCTASKHLFQLSHSVNGKPTKYTKEEMRSNLLQVIRDNNLADAVGDKTPAELAAASAPTQHTHYVESETQSESYVELKSKLTQRIEEDHVKRAVKQTKLHLDILIDNPRILTNKKIKHKCIDPNGTAKWYNALITDVTTSEHEDKNKVMRTTMFSIKYEQAELGDDEPLEEIFPLLIDLKNNDLIIIDPLD